MHGARERVVDDEYESEKKEKLSSRLDPQNLSPLLLPLFFPPSHPLHPTKVAIGSLPPSPQDLLFRNWRLFQGGTFQRRNRLLEDGSPAINLLGASGDFLSGVLVMGVILL